MRDESEAGANANGGGTAYKVCSKLGILQADSPLLTCKFGLHPFSLPTLAYYSWLFSTQKRKMFLLGALCTITLFFCGAFLQN